MNSGNTEVSHIWICHNTNQSGGNTCLSSHATEETKLSSLGGEISERTPPSQIKGTHWIGKGPGSTRPHVYQVIGPWQPKVMPMLLTLHLPEPGFIEQVYESPCKWPWTQNPLCKVFFLAVGERRLSRFRRPSSAVTLHGSCLVLSLMIWKSPTENSTPITSRTSKTQKQPW